MPWTIENSNGRLTIVDERGREIAYMCLRDFTFAEALENARKMTAAASRGDEAVSLASGRSAG